MFFSESSIKKMFKFKLFWPKIYDKKHKFWENFQLYKSRILTKFGKTVKLAADKLTDITVMEVHDETPV